MPVLSKSLPANPVIGTPRPTETGRVGAVRGATWLALESAGGQGVSFLVFLALARLLSPADFGVIAVATVYVLVAQYLIFQGLGQAILQFEDLDELHLDTIFWINFGVGSTLVALTLAGASTAEAWIRTPGLGGVLRGLSPVLLIAALTDVPNNLLTREMRFRKLASRTFLSYLAGGAAAILCAFRGAGAWSLVAQQITVWLVNFVMLWSATSWRPRFRFCLQRARRLLRFGVHLLWSDLVGLVNRRSDQLFVSRFFGPVIGGFYSVGARVAMLVGEVLVRSFGRVTVTVLSRLQNEGARFNSAVYEAVEMQSALILPVAVGFSLVAPDVVAIFLGPKWTAAVPIMQALLLAGPFEALSTVHQSTLVARGKPQWCSTLATLQAVASLAIFAAALRWGPAGVAAGYALRGLLLYPVELAVLRRVAGLAPSRFFRLLSPQAGAALLMAGAVLLLRTQLAPLSPFLLLPASVLAGAGVYIGAMALLNPRLTSELWSYISLRNRRACAAAPTPD